MSSSLADRVQDPSFIGSLIATGVAALALKNFTNIGWVVAIILGGLIGGSLYVLYQDYVEKQKLEDAEQAKQKDLQRRIKEQAQEEQKIGKCVSCTAELPEGAEECPECGFAVQHYSKA